MAVNKQELTELVGDVGFEKFTEYFNDIVDFVIETYGYEYVNDIIKLPEGE